MDDVISNHELDLAWNLLRMNDEFKRDFHEASLRPESKCGADFVLDRLKLIEYRSEDELLKGKWGILNVPRFKDVAGHTIFWDPSISVNTIEIRLCESEGPKLSDIFRLPNAKVTGVVFERSGRCIIKITQRYKFYQLVISDFYEADHNKSIQLCIPATQDFLAKVKTAQSISELLKKKNLESTGRIQAARESLLVAWSIEEGVSHREIASRLFGSESVKNNWAPDSWMRAKTRYSINKTQLLIRGGYRKLI